MASFRSAQNNRNDTVILKPGDSGRAIFTIQKALSHFGFLQGSIDGHYGPVTQAAVSAFQKSRQIVATGLVDNFTLQALGFQIDTAAVASRNTFASNPVSNPHHFPNTANPQNALPMAMLTQIFPHAPAKNFHQYYPILHQILAEQGLADPVMLLMALATIRVETSRFEPISEFESRYNTEPGGRPYGLYDFRTDIGNNAVGDGERYKGRGFIQLTGKANYTTYSDRLGLGPLLIDRPELANDPVIAAKILAAFLKDKETIIRTALHRNDFETARRAVNGGTHGLSDFKLAFNIGSQGMGIIT
ncbi:MAG: peptidoglycan-binding protein [Cyanobacteria bacterium P01_H01_bin.74]